MDRFPQPSRRRLSRLAAAARRLVDPGGLHRCPACGEAFVCPVDWEIDGKDHWRMQLRCAACDTWRDVRATNDEAKEFDLVLDRQCGEIHRELLRIDREQMRAELELLTAALEHDLIDAADFAR